MRWYEYKMEVDDLHASDDLERQSSSPCSRQKTDPETRQETEKSHPLSPQGSEHRRLRPALRRWSVCGGPLPLQPAACGRRGPQLCP